jgi:hypothetical protein
VSAGLDWLQGAAMAGWPTTVRQIWCDDVMVEVPVV